MRTPAPKPESYGPSKVPDIITMVQQHANQHSYPPNFTLPYKGTTIPPEVKHYGPATFPTANEFAFFLDYIGQGYGFIFDGAWCKDRSYAIANILSGNAMEPVPQFSLENVAPLWKTAGFPYTQTFYTQPDRTPHMTKQEMTDAIKYALYVLRQPVVMPQEPFFGSIVVGYKDEGNTLVTFRYNPYFVDQENNARAVVEDVTDWQTTSLFIAGKREHDLPVTDAYEMGLAHIKECLYANIHGTKQHYFTDWEAFLCMSLTDMLATVRHTGNVPGGIYHSTPAEYAHKCSEKDDDILWQFIAATHESTWCDMAERRFYIIQFIQQAMDYLPYDKEKMQTVADHFANTNYIMGDGYHKEIGDPIDAEVFKDSAVRTRMADYVRQFKEADAKGLELVEQLLATART